MSKTELTDTQRYWLGHIQSCEAKGQTIAAYATAKKLNRNTLYSWRRDLKKRGVLAELPPDRTRRKRRAQPTHASFRPVQIVDMSPAVAPIRIHFRNGVTLELSSANDIPDSNFLSTLASLS